MVPKGLEMPNSEGQNKDKHITEDGFWFLYYGLKEVSEVITELRKRADILIKGEGDGNNSNNKTN